jgi:DNA repair protein SbcC/Rad50
MKLLSSLFGKKSKQTIVKDSTPIVVPVKPPKPVITLDEVNQAQDEDTLLKLASEGATTQVRQAAAEKIHSREVLENLAKLAKQKDKNVFKIVKAKLDVFKSADHELADLETSAKRVAEKMEKHSHLEADALFKAKLDLLKQEWHVLEQSASTPTQASYAKALAACEAKIQAKAQAIADEEEKHQLDAQAIQLAEAAVGNIQTLSASLLKVSEWSNDLFNEYEAKVQELTNAMRLAMNRNLPLDYLAKSFEQRKQQALNLLDQLKTYGSAKQILAQVKSLEGDEQQAVQQKLNQLMRSAKELGEDAVEAVADVKQEFADWMNQRRQVEQAAKDAVRDFSDLLRKGLWSAEQGFVRKARAIQKELQAKLEGFSDLPKGLQNKLEEFEQQLAKLGDWHEFAVTPKKEALITQMQALVTSSMAPADKASKIHDLQDTWKEVSKGGQQQDDQLWNEFQQASQLAYAPCKEYFEKQAAEREMHLQKRREMVAQLKGYLQAYDWENAVWKDVEQTLKTARQEWQTYWPVPRKAGNDLQKEFETLMEDLFNKMASAFDANKQQKQSLVEQAKQLLSLADTRAACDSIKQLQSSWKSVGKTWFKEDQSLWNEFRQTCDAVFARRQEEANAAQAERQSILSQANQLIESIRELSRQELTDLAVVKSQMESAEQQFAGLELPRDQAKNLQQSLQNAVSAVNDKIRQFKQQAEKNRWQVIYSAARQLHSFEVSVVAGKSSEESYEAISHLISANGDWPKAIVSALQSRLTKAKNLMAADVEISNKKLRELVLRADILAGRESPEDEKPARMRYQVQQMQQGLGKREVQFGDLQLEWFATPALVEDYDQLLKRFLA